MQNEEFEKKERRIKDELERVYRMIYDPEIPANIYDLGLIYSVTIEENGNYTYAHVEMTLTSPACPVAESLVDQVRYATSSVPEVDEAYVKLVFDPPWEPSMMNDDAREIMGASGAAIF